jgi:spore germination cell wall hydrolase CwlJ-like protein
MLPVPYNQLSDDDLFALCIWREARGSSFLAKVCVGWVILNRVARGGWWGDTVRFVILKPWQFSSFNESDPNSAKYPADNDPSWPSSKAAVQFAKSSPDPTDGATHYHDKSVGWPGGWGAQNLYTQTLTLDDFVFYRYNQMGGSNKEEVADAATGEN